MADDSEIRERGFRPLPLASGGNSLWAATAAWVVRGRREDMVIEGGSFDDDDDDGDDEDVARFLRCFTMKEAVLESSYHRINGDERWMDNN